MTPAGTSNELDVQNGWEENTHTHSLEPKKCYNNIVIGKEIYAVTFYNKSAGTFYYVRVRIKLLFHSLKIQPLDGITVHSN